MSDETKTDKPQDEGTGFKPITTQEEFDKVTAGIRYAEFWSSDILTGNQTRYSIKKSR
ncbi:MAG: hypothetical protein FWG00_05880 [Coriobacteriia bacterium]|nr:hypothetical protein [Coriobacteriia bacterium]